MADAEGSRQDLLLVDVDEARRQAFELVRAVGDLVWGVREAEAKMPDVGSGDPAFTAVAGSLNHARNDARADVDGYARRVCALIAAVYAGIVTLDEVDQAVAADLKGRSVSL